MLSDAVEDLILGETENFHDSFAEIIANINLKLHIQKFFPIPIPSYLFILFLLLKIQFFTPIEMPKPT